ncbi:MAG: T9SS type A sorting domain-containing protein [Bacteroidales bacterium]|nr:T9SS type A sorting domain-containing protein [Bacteroidales bacterium]
MRKLIFLILIIFSSNCFSQETWAPTGTTWYYNLHQDSEFGYIKIESQKDTLVENKLCKYLVATKNVYAVPGNYISQKIDSFITYQDNYKIYIYQMRKFIMIYDFNPAVGDVWKTWEIWNSYNTLNTGYEQSDTTACPTGRVRVDSVKNVILANKTLKVIYTSAYQGSSMNFTNVILENIGCLGYLLPIYECNQHMDTWYPGDIRCFNSPDFSYSWSNKDCDYITALNNLKIAPPVTILPNPAVGEINITVDQKYLILPIQIIVSSLSGIQVLKETMYGNNFSLLTDNLLKGMYFLSFRDSNSLFYTSKIIIK